LKTRVQVLLSIALVVYIIVIVWHLVINIWLVK
jgi:hypothetical protein